MASRDAYQKLCGLIAGSGNRKIQPQVEAGIKKAASFKLQA